MVKIYMIYFSVKYNKVLLKSKNILL